MSRGPTPSRGEGPGFPGWMQGLPGSPPSSPRAPHRRAPRPQESVGSLTPPVLASGAPVFDVDSARLRHDGPSYVLAAALHPRGFLSLLPGFIAP